MIRIFTLLAVFLTGFAFAQTTEYTTGNGTTDDWTGWSSPVVTGVTADSYTGIHSWQFSGMNSQNYTIETYRQFNINSDDIDIYFNCLTQDATFSIEHSPDNGTYTEIGTSTVGAGYSIHNLLIPTFNPASPSFFLKIKVSGTFGSPSNTQLYDFKIDAVLNSSGIDDLSLGSNVIYANSLLSINTSLVNYEVSVIDITGKVLTTKSNLKEFDMNHLNNGIYFVAISDMEGRRKTMKIVHTK